MRTIQNSFELSEYDSIDELPAADKDLLQMAKETTKNAYAPYSGFWVGAAAILQNGKIVTGTNQENASYPVGICAERTLLSAASSLYPGIGIHSIAISYDNTHGASNRPVSPCGICRQSLVEFENRTSQKIRLILSGLTGKVQVINSASLLLPLSFTNDDLK